MIEQPTRRCHQDVDAASELRRLRPEADSPEDCGRREVEMLAVGSYRHFDLRGKFARWRDDQRAQRLAHTGMRRRLARQSLEHWQDESSGLAGSRLGTGEQIAASEHGG